MDEEMNVNSHHAGVFKTASFRKLQTAYPRPTFTPTLLNPAPSQKSAPLCTTSRAPGPGFGRGRERRGAGRSGSLDSLLPRRH